RASTASSTSSPAVAAEARAPWTETRTRPLPTTWPISCGSKRTPPTSAWSPWMPRASNSTRCTCVAEALLRSEDGLHAPCARRARSLAVASAFGSLRRDLGADARAGHVGVRVRRDQPGHCRHYLIVVRSDLERRIGVLVHHPYVSLGVDAHADGRRAARKRD